jgi:catechol 2,3-dioxygenase-like lactoylglutathione lyase family enzyme
MPITNGFNHVATLTTDMDKTIRFYEQAFDGRVVHEIAKSQDHPWMKIVDLGGGAALNVFEARADEIIGERRKQGGRGAIDHYALAVAESSNARHRTHAACRGRRARGWRHPTARQRMVAVLS